MDIKVQAAYHLALLNFEGVRLDLITTAILDDLKAKARTFGVRAVSFTIGGLGSHVNSTQYPHTYAVTAERRIPARGLEAVGGAYMIGVDSDTAQAVAELQTIYERRCSSLYG
jgi:hypothetical protein